MRIYNFFLIKMSDHDEISKYIGGDKNIEISKDVEDLFRLMLLNDEVEKPPEAFFNPYDILGLDIVQKECRRSLSTLHQKKSCIFYNTLFFNIDSDTVEFSITKKLADPNLIRKWADSCKTDIIGIPFGVDSSSGAHANIVVVNKKLKTIEHFEPHGEASGEGLISTENSKKFKSIIKNFFKKCCFPDYKYVEPKDVCPLVGDKIKVMGVQTIQNLLDANKKSNPVAKSIQGSCAWWSMWYLNVRIVHPELSANEAYDKAFRTMLNVREGEKANLYEVESFIVTFMKKLLTLANFTLTSHKHSKEDKTMTEHEEDLIKKGFYMYHVGINNKRISMFTKISPEMLYSEKSTEKKSTKKKSTEKKSTKKKSTKKKCPEGKIINPATGRCVSKTGKIGRELLNSKKSAKKSKKSAKKSKKSVKCVKGKIINPKTNRCVSKTGKIGRSLK